MAKEEMNINKAVEIIEKHTVFRNTVLTDRSGFFIAVNDADHKPFEVAHKKIIELAETVKDHKAGCIYDFNSLKERLALCRNCKYAKFGDFGVYCDKIEGYAISKDEIKNIDA